MRKYRVACPHCEAILLVTEDLLGQPGNCPGCLADFLLPTEESFSHDALASAAHDSVSVAASTVTPVDEPHLDVQSLPDDFSAATPSRPRKSRKSVKIEGRPALRLLAGMLRGMAALQAFAGIAILVILLVNAVKSPMPADMVLITVGVAVLVGSCSIPTLAFSELIIVFISHEEISRHILNELRSEE